MLTRPLERSKNGWEDDIKNNKKKLKIKNWTSYIQDRNISGNYMLRRPNCSKNEVVALRKKKKRRRG
jgi:hypothetical protein